jgi:hypothetical protein
MTLYECQNYLYLVAFCENDGPTKFLRIDRTQGDKLALRHVSYRILVPYLYLQSVGTDINWS